MEQPWQVTVLRSVLAVVFCAVICLFLALRILGAFQVPMIRPPPSPSYEDEAASAPDFLKQCQPDELRIVTFGQGDSSKEGIGLSKINLTTGAFEERATDHYRAFGFTSSDMPFHPYREDVLKKIRATIAALPPPSPESFFHWTSYRHKYHMAFFRNGSICVYAYPENADKSPYYLLDYILNYGPNITGQ
jgi:hypothetical protein